ncbi:membrane-bound serine protease (ClpP class) [Roseivirga ehrenbergii]|uniref:NfeD family protein n=1 Tax=Roseivirga ehrenbergii (strain DSM 102268 / JCM 13514 / KCTC 12282 / NCIMB 14502 / KMM 6017) TaxID=279360 RepID=UPI000B2FEA03|nr:NfeD family protein [Roseivirga ehrenbergii]TCL00962.1 membrane-bound serine protease (ClpP class) [Roseivirga ehrenbergii]
MLKFVRRIGLIFLAILFCAGLFAEWNPFQDPAKKRIFVMEIRNDIDPRMNRYVDLALDQATEENADIVIIDMDTYGGAVNDANDIRTRILEYEKPVWVFINNDAASAGALISIACDSIYMVPGANIGAATVVNGEDGSQAPDKYQSYMRSIMRSTAEQTNRDPNIAEGMVDDRIEIEGVTEAGKTITFTTSEAIKNGFCEMQVTSIEDILAKNNIDNYELINYELAASEKIIAFFLNPFVSGILILVIVGGLYFELQTPGVGFPLAAAGIALVFYLTPYYLNGLAANWEIAVLFIGIVLIALEVFVIPGFGVAGIAGISCVVMALIFVMIDNDFFNFDYVPSGELGTAAVVVFAGMLGAMVLIFSLGYRFTESKMFSKVALMGEQRKSDGYTSSFYTADLMGKEGIVFSTLRPSGRVEINGEIYDAYTRGEYVEKGEKITVISQEGTSLKVRSKKV